MRWFAGDMCDAYLVRANIQRGLTIAVLRGRHVIEPTELTDTHIVPGYADEPRPGSPFPIPDPEPPPMPDERLEAEALALRHGLAPWRLLEQERPQGDVALLVYDVVGVAVRRERDALDPFDGVELVDRLGLDGAAAGDQR